MGDIFVLLLLIALFANIVTVVIFLFEYDEDDWEEYILETKVKHLIFALLFPVVWIFVIVSLFKLDYSPIKLVNFLNKPIRKGDK